MIEVVMGNDYFRQRFVRNERSGLINVGFRVGFASVSFEHREMIIELEDRRISSSASQVPDSLRNRYSLNVEPRRRWRGRRSHGLESGEIANGTIDHILIHIELVPYDVPEIDGGVIAGRQHQAFFGLIPEE